MLFTTSTQFAVLALCLLAGWVFGLASHPGGRKWKERLRTAEAEHAAYRKDAEARITAAEAERARLAKAAPVTAQMTAAPVAPAAAATGTKGFFGWGRDNLARIRGIDDTLEKRLNDEGIKTYHQVETMSADDERELEARLGLGAGAIAQQHWREQATMLREGADDVHGQRFA